MVPRTAHCTRGKKKITYAFKLSEQCQHNNKPSKNELYKC